MKMTGSAVWWVLTIIACCLTVLAVPMKKPLDGSVVEALCRRTEVPANRPHGTNRLSDENWDPVYKLSVSKDEHEKDYIVSVKLGSRLLPFSDAFISAETNGSCGVGQFLYHSSDFYRVVQPPLQPHCPLLLTTNRKSAMQGLPPLRWQAPPCGCVHFRAMVIEASTVYYAEQANKAEGPLAITICSPLADHSQKKLTIQERTELLCQVTERNSGLSIIQRPRFMHNHRLEPRYMDARALDLALGARRHDISICCAKKGAERSTCLTDVRRRRVDGFCEDGVPDVPFSVLRASFMRQREESCCWRLAEDRYSCFSEDSELKTGKGSVDFSLDETNPLNDLADYDEELRSLEKEMGTTFVARAVTENPLLISPSTTHPTTTTTSSTTTTTPTTTPTTTTPTTPSPFLPPFQLPRQSSPGFPPFPQNGPGPMRVGQGQGQGSERRRGGEEGRKSVGVKGGRSWRYEGVDVEDGGASLVSREIGEQGGSSIDKTFHALKRRMWKLSLKTRCCQGGMGAARAAFGDFHAVWSQCQHSGHKFLAQQALRQGHKLCSSQFHKCCMEMAISLPPEVVTMAPDMASSREWDRDRHLVHSGVYLPPHARTLTRPDLPTPKDQQKAITPIKSPLSVRVSPAVRKSPWFDEEDIGEESDILRHKTSRRPRFREQSILPRARNVVSAGRDDNVSRRQRQLRKMNSRERKSGRRSRERLGKERGSRRYLDEYEEEPTFKRKPRRKQNSGGRSSKERRNRQGQMRRGSLLSVPEHVHQDVLSKADRAERNQPSLVSDTTTASSVPQKGNAGAVVESRRRELRRKLEEEQFRRLFAEIAEDVEDEEESLIDEDVDAGSEENADTLGLTGSKSIDFDDDNEDEEEEEEEEEDEDYDDEEDENFAEESDIEKANKAITSSEKSADIKTETVQQDSNKHKPSEKPAQKNEPQPLSQVRSQKKANVEDNSERLEASARNSDSLPFSPAPPRQKKANQELMNTSSARKRQRLRLRSRGSLASSEDEGHGMSRQSGGRSGRRKRKNLQGRKRTRNLRHYRRRLRDRERRREFAEALEED